MEQSFLGCAGERDSLLSPEHLIGRLHAPHHREKPPVAISSFLIYQRGDRLCFIVDTATGRDGDCSFLLTAEHLPLLSFVTNGKSDRSKTMVELSSSPPVL